MEDKLQRLHPATAEQLRRQQLPSVVPLEFRQDGDDYLQADLAHNIIYAFEEPNDLSLHLYPTTPSKTLKGLRLLVEHATFISAYLGKEASETQANDRLEFTWNLPFTDENKLFYAQSAQYLQRQNL